MKKNFTEEIFITYGCGKHFDRSKFREIKNREVLSIYHKPHGGLWSSPVNSDIGWKDWCLGEDFMLEKLKESFRFKIKETSKVYIIDNEVDLKNIPMKLETSFSFRPFERCIDYEGMKNVGYDAIWLTGHGMRSTREDHYGMTTYGFDCETLLILNPDIIEEI